MDLIDGNRFRIRGKDNEAITVVMTDGTVGKVTTDLDGAPRVLAKGEKLVFNLEKGKRKSLIMTYVFKAPSDEFYETQVTGSQGGASSVDKHEQGANETEKTRAYTFDAD